MGDRHLVTVPQEVVGDRLPWGGERQGGGGVHSWLCFQGPGPGWISVPEVIMHAQLHRVPLWESASENTSQKHFYWRQPGRSKQILWT